MPCIQEEKFLIAVMLTDGFDEFSIYLNILSIPE